MTFAWCKRGVLFITFTLNQIPNNNCIGETPRLCKSLASDSQADHSTYNAYLKIVDFTDDILTSLKRC